MLKHRILKLTLIISLVSILALNVSFAMTGEINDGPARLRKEPSTKAKIITLMEAGSKVEIISKQGDWFNIKIGSYTGWVAESLLDVDKANEVKQDNEDTIILAVVGSTVNLREGPTTQTSIVGKVVQGDNLVSYGKTTDGLWYKVKFANTEGYIYSEYVSTDMDKILGDGTINDKVNFREGPSTDASVISTLSANSKIKIIGCEGEWYNIIANDKEGWVVARCVDRVTVTSRSGSNSTAQKVVELAKKQLGKKYVWGGNGPNSFDCSGLTKYVYGKVGVNLERISYNQAEQGIAVKKENLQAGDLVFFSGINATSSSAKISHVGIYIGNDQFIHASNPTRGVVQDDINDSYYSKHYVKARRVIR